MADANLLIQIQAETGQALDRIGKLGQSVDKLEQTTKKAGTSGNSMFSGLVGGAAKLGLAATGIGAVVQGVGALAGGFTGIIKTGADFDQKLAQIRATSGASAEELATLKDKALELGKATDVGSVSASDAADAIFELGKAGLSVTTIANGAAKATLQLAAAAGPDFGVANAAALAADALNTFKREGLTATDAANDLVGAANASSIGLGDLKFSLSAVGPVASQLGIGFKDFNVIMAQFGLNGLKGSDAGTSLKSMLLHLIPTTTAATGEMMKLGLITSDGANAFFDSEGHMKSWHDVAGILHESTKNLSDEQRTLAFNTIFGTDAIRAANIVAADGAAGFDNMATQVTKQGDAAKVAADMSNNLNGKMEALQGTLDTVKIKLAEYLIPLLGQFADKGNDLAGNLLNNIDPAVQHLSEFLGNLRDILQPILGPLGLFHHSLMQIAEIIFNQVLPALGKLLGGDQKGAVDQLTFAWQGFLNNFTDIHRALENVGGALGTLAGKLWTWITDATPRVLQALGEWGSAIWNWISGVGLPQLGLVISDWSGRLWNWVTDAAPRVLQSLGEWGANIWNWLTSTALPTLLEKTKQLSTGLASWIEDAKPVVMQKLNELWTGVLNFINTVWIPTLKVHLDRAAVVMDTWVQTSGNKFRGDFITQLNKTLDSIGQFFHNLKQAFLGLGSTAVGEGTDAMGSTLITHMAKLFLDVALKIPAWIHDITTTIQNHVGEWIVGFISFWPELMVKTYEKMNAFGAAIIGQLVVEAIKVGKAAVEVGKRITDGIRDGLENTWRSLVNKLQGLVDMLPQAVKDLLHITSPSRVFADIGKQMVAGMAVGIGEGWPAVEIAMRGSVEHMVAQTQQQVALGMRQLMQFPHMQGDVPGAGGGGSNFLGGVTGGGGPGGSGGGGSYMASGVGIPGGVNSDVTIIVKLDSEIISRTLGRRERMRSDG